MTEEEYIRNRLDMINRNSVYGLYPAISSEIAKIIHSYIERDIGTEYDRFNSPPPPIPIIPVKVKSLKERLEENKMGATSIEKFHDIVAITFELQTFPDLDEQDKFIVTAANRDDIFEFEFEGPHLVDVCRNAGILTSWEKDQKIREFEEKVREKDKKIGELEKDNKNLTEAYDSMYESVGRALREQQRLKEEYEEKIRELQEKIFHLEALKTPTIENFTVEEISDQSWADNVNHPSHYTGRYECIDVMQDVFGDEATDNFCLCNAFKYIWRARKKNGLEDVKKAVWYLNKYIEEAEKDGVRKWKQI